MRRNFRGNALKWLGLLAVVGTLLFGDFPLSAQDSLESKHPNILLLLNDDQRPDTIRALGNPEIRTPHLDRLVQAGTTLMRATCGNPICTPSRAEIMSGCSGFRNGVFDFGRKIRSDAPLWAATMRDAGYRTCYVGKWHNSGHPRQWGYETTRGLFTGGGGRWAVPTFDWNGRLVTGYRGWIFQTDSGRLQPERGVGLTANISEIFADAAIDLIRRKSDRPFFLHVNFTAPHDPLLLPHGYENAYDPRRISIPENFLPVHPFDHGNLRGRDERLFASPRTRREVQRELAVYYAVISHMDAQIGRILDALKNSGQFETTLIIFASDHGLAIGSHGLRGKQNLYEHTLSVPLILRGPGIPSGMTSAAQCYLRDLFPTVCDLTGIPIPSGVEGHSLKPVLTGQADSIHPYVFGYFRNVQRAIRTDRWKLIHYPQIGRDQLFDLKEDPYERNDLSQDEGHAARLAQLREQLIAWQHKVGDPVLNASDE